MRYWDASALVPLLVAEPATPSARTWLEQDPVVVTWAWSVVEMSSAVERRFRDGTIGHTARRELLGRLSLLVGQWDEITDTLAVRRHATRLLARHSLRAADAGQLGAALVLFDDRPEGHEFVCLDQRLAHAAEMEGFTVLGAPTES